MKNQPVEAFLAATEHPFKPEIVALRQIILGADPAIAEDIKWNAPSFLVIKETGECMHFATFQLRAKDGVQIILHLGAKKREAAGLEIADPAALLAWLAKDRASVKFRDMQHIEAVKIAFAALLRQWLRHV